MNKARRKQLERVQSLIMEAKELMSQVSEEEYDAYNNLPELLQVSERGEKMKVCVYLLDEHLDTLDDIFESLEEIILG